ncbi:MAG: hypothetical protein ACLT9P_02095 [Evtepia gabavorous]
MNIAAPTYEFCRADTEALAAITPTLLHGCLQQYHCVHRPLPSVAARIWRGKPARSFDHSIASTGADIISANKVGLSSAIVGRKNGIFTAWPTVRTGPARAVHQDSDRDDATKQVPNSAT